MAAAMAYHEPSILTILIQCSFLLALNSINYLLDRIMYCGLVGQIFIGVAWGTPGAKLIATDAEPLITQLGYLGLILIVYEGGLSTSVAAIKSNGLLSTGVAITGICLPVAFSFVLMGLVAASPLQAFAAGAALCSTSLGTTFTVLGTSGLTTTRLGSVLTTAAMLDDVVGLIMVQVISNLGVTSEVSVVTVARPIAVSVGIVVVLFLFCRYLIKPVAKWLMEKTKPRPETLFSQKFLRGPETLFVIHTAFLTSMVTAASYAGTSNLFAAYLAGVAISWIESDLTPPTLPVNIESVNSETDGVMNGYVNDSREADRDKVQTRTENRLSPASPQDASLRTSPVNKVQSWTAPVTDQTPKQKSYMTSGRSIYEAYYAPATMGILKPFFFASIGFSIPITQMFHPTIIWRGLVYTLLMVLGKLLTGAWLLRLSFLAMPLKSLRTFLRKSSLRSCFTQLFMKTETPATSLEKSKVTESSKAQISKTSATTPFTLSPSGSFPSHLPSLRLPQSLYPSAILALAMISRGEIGFLIASVAESEGLFGGNGGEDRQPSQLFLVIVWAITLCTIIGHVGVGLVVRRVRALQEKRQGDGEGAREGVLGTWGVG